MFRNKKRIFDNFLFYFIITLITMIFLFPIYWIVISSLKPPEELFTVPPKLFLDKITFKWYVEVFKESNIPSYFLNSLIIATITTLVSLIISSLGAYSVSRFNYRGRSIILISLLLSYVFPPILLFLPMYLILAKFQLINNFLGAIVTHTTITLPFSVWLLRSFFKKIPIELEESALIDGCSRFGAFLKIAIPLVAPGLFSTGIFAFILSWNEYLYSSVILTDENLRTISVGIAELVTQYDIRWGAMMAAATLTTIPVLVIFSFIQKYFVQGLTAGAVKG